MSTQAFFLPLETRQKDYPKLTKKMGRFWHTGIIHNDKTYECFSNEKHLIANYNNTKKQQLKSLKAVFVNIEIDEAKLKTEITSGTSCSEYLARVIGVSDNKGRAKRYLPDEVFNLIKSDAKKPKGKLVIVNDKMQKNYRYHLTAPTGKKFSSEFKPELTPKQMLELGVFGGKYMTDCQKEFPKTWFTKAKLNPAKHDGKLNFFKINASQSLAVWRNNNWIHAADPRGWFQWYCRYYMGRRLLAEDQRQIKRWQAMRRHISQIKNNCQSGNLDCHRRQRQAVLHWAYDSRKY